MMDIAIQERAGSLNPVHQSATAQHWTDTCLNCGAVLSGDYCATCGQRALPPYPTIRELAGDAFSEFSGWDGKFLRSLKLLIFHPGELTRRFLLGKRIQSISPLRIYLMCSFVFFALTALVPTPPITRANGQIALTPGVQIGLSDGPQSASAQRPALSPGMDALVLAMDRGLNNLDPATRATAERQLQKAPGFLRPIFRALALDKEAFLARIKEAMPRAFFVLIPGLAFTLAVFYRGRHYPEHIYFAMHFQSFVFLMMALNPLAELTGSVPLKAIVRLLTIVAIISYEVIALRRVYGGTTGKTIAKALGMAAFTAPIGIGMLVGVMYWSSRAYFGA